MLERLLSFDTWLFHLGNVSAANSFFDTIMPIITSNTYIVPVLLAYIVGVVWRGTAKDQIFILLVIAGLVVAYYSGDLWKQVFMRPRPCHHLSEIHLLVPCSSSVSFPSGHAINAFTLATFAALCYRNFGKWLFMLAALSAYSRVYCGVHYPLDVIGGALWGATISLGIYWLYQQALPKKSPFRFHGA